MPVGADDEGEAVEEEEPEGSTAEGMVVLVVEEEVRGASGGERSRICTVAPFWAKS